MEAENILMAPGQIRLTNAGIEFKVLKIEGSRVFCQTLEGKEEWSSSLEFLQPRSKFIRSSE